MVVCRLISRYVQSFEITYFSDAERDGYVENRCYYQGDSA